MNNGIEDVLASPGGYFIPIHIPLLIPMSNLDTHNIDIYYTQLYTDVRVSSKCIEWLRKEAEARHIAQSPVPKVDYESQVESINRFYGRVCMLINHQRMADPLMDVLVYFLKK